MTLLLKGTPVMFVSVYLTCNTGIAGTNLQKLTEFGSYVTNAGIPFRHCGGLERAAFRIAGIKLDCPYKGGDLASVCFGNLVHLWKAD